MSTVNAPILSIIVPVYNVQDYLEECLDSIINQTLNNIEILVVDDGSTDSSSEIIRTYSAKDSRIRPFFKINGGLSDARNYGLDRVRGKYITFVDSDDVLLNNDIYEKVIAVFGDHPEVDAVQYEVIHKWNSPYQHKRDTVAKEYIGTENILAGYLKEQTQVSCCDKIFRAEVFDTIRFPKGEISEDIAIIPQIANNAKGIFISTIGYYGYRYRESSISNARPQPWKIYSILRSYKKYLVCCLRYDGLKNIALGIYCSVIWNYTSIMSRNYKENLEEYYSQQVFVKTTFADWLNYNAPSLQAKVKAFIICVAGIRFTAWCQRLLSR